LILFDILPKTAQLTETWGLTVKMADSPEGVRAAVGHCGATKTLHAGGLRAKISVKEAVGFVVFNRCGAGIQLLDRAAWSSDRA
jgi:hypothetical protein